MTNKIMALELSSEALKLEHEQIKQANESTVAQQNEAMERELQEKAANAIQIKEL